ncbi:MAG TPA: BON domain-containing protein [Thermoanaerobaculia bacterium]|nr:BON domain-containing protein [Thermoanaerobaculia bacterium]
MAHPRTAPTLTAVLAVLFLLVATPASSSVPEVRNLGSQFAELGLAIQELQAFEVGGIVILRGRAETRSAALAAGERAQALGYTRVANLIRIVRVPNDAELRRDVQRELAVHDSLAGSRISVDAENGIVYLRGSVQHEMQKDLAVAVLRSVDGVREVRAQLERR